MGLLSASDEAVLKQHLSAIESRVSLLLFTQTIGGSESGPVAKQVLDEIASLNDKIERRREELRARHRGPGEVRRRARADHRRAARRRRTPACGSSARRPATSSCRSSKPSCWPAPGNLELEPAHDDAARGGRQTDRHQGVLDTHLTALSEGGRPRAQDGVCQPEHHRHLGRSHGVHGSVTALPRDRCAQDHRQRDASRSWARCPRSSSSSPHCRRPTSLPRRRPRRFTARDGRGFGLLFRACGT